MLLTINNKKRKRQNIDKLDIAKYSCLIYSVKILIVLLLLVIPFGINAQGRNEYEKRFVEVHLIAPINCMVISDDSQKNRRDKLLYPNGEQIKSLAGLFGYMESLGFKLHESVSTGFGM